MLGIIRVDFCKMFIGKLSIFYFLDFFSGVVLIPDYWLLLYVQFLQKLMIYTIIFYLLL